MCDTQGRGGKNSFEEPICSNGKAKEASHCHVKGALPEGSHIIEEELQRGG